MSCTKATQQHRVDDRPAAFAPQRRHQRLDLRRLQDAMYPAKDGGETAPEENNGLLGRRATAPIAC
jgi:hypothetical protein